MTRTLWAAAITLLVVVAGFGAAGTLYLPNPQPEQLVEGHTVFTVLQAVNVTRTQAHFAAAVAVLVREIVDANAMTRFPGVLWFNDQYLVNPNDDSPSATPRYPCDGAVIAVNAGDPNPGSTLENGTGTYIESYHITDPNDHSWDIDKWSVDNGGIPELAWSVALMNGQANSNKTDDGTSCPAVVDNPCGGPDVLPVVPDSRPMYNDSGAREDREVCVAHARGVSENVLGVASHKAVGDNGYNYPCGGKDTAPTPTCAPLLRYNAVLFFLLDDLNNASAPKNHTKGSTDYQNDVSACSPPTSAAELAGTADGYPCPNNDDNREGNSHPYNPGNRYPLTTYDGRGNHGGSADCTGDGVNDTNCHATRNVDIYYDRVAPPTVRNYIIMDVEGSTAPYHCEPGMTVCNQNDL